MPSRTASSTGCISLVLSAGSTINRSQSFDPKTNRNGRTEESPVVARTVILHRPVETENPIGPALGCTFRTALGRCRSVLIPYRGTVFSPFRLLNDYKRIYYRFIHISYLNHSCINYVRQFPIEYFTF